LCSAYTKLGQRGITEFSSSRNVNLAVNAGDNASVLQMLKRL